MNALLLYLLLFSLPAVLILGLILWRQARNTRAALAKLEDAKISGLTEPASLHPVIDPALCLGCGTCVAACPEGDILGLVKRKAQLVSPSSCIGHGACKEACPTNAITLVFGTERRGVEIPSLSEDFETSVPGIFIAGELGGMGLIKNAISQGQQAVAAAAKKRPQSQRADYQLIIVGAGPAGLAAALAAKQRKLKYIVLEQDTIGGTVAHYPRGKVVMTAPANLPLVGKFQFREASKEKLVEFWNSVLAREKLAIQVGARVVDIQSSNSSFNVTIETKGGQTEALTTSTVLLTMGRRGTPRKLGVPGEELSKVVYRLVDPRQYAGKNVLVVGGGDSALEAALAIADESGSKVTVSYRSDAFSRAKGKNRDAIAAAQANNVVDVLLESQVLEITDDHVRLQTSNGEISVENDAVIVCVGGILPTPFLKKIGIQVDEKFGTV